MRTSACRPSSWKRDVRCPPHALLSALKLSTSCLLRFRSEAQLPSSKDQKLRTTSCGKQELHYYDTTTSLSLCVLHQRDRNNQNWTKVPKMCFSAGLLVTILDTIPENPPQNIMLEAQEKKREVKALPLWFLDGLVFHFLFTFFYHGA